MSKRQPKSDYAVGYAKPPRTGQFQKGRSGNPSGRRKAVSSFAAEVHAELNRRHAIMVNGKQVFMTGRRALAKKLIKLAFDGMAWAHRIVVKLDEGHIAAASADSRTIEIECSKEDEEQLMSFVEQWNAGEPS